MDDATANAAGYVKRELLDDIQNQWWNAVASYDPMCDVTLAGDVKQYVHIVIDKIRQKAYELGQHGRLLSEPERQQAVEPKLDAAPRHPDQVLTFDAGDSYGMLRVFGQMEQYLETGTCQCKQIIDFAVRLEGKFRSPVTGN